MRGALTNRGRSGSIGPRLNECLAPYGSSRLLDSIDPEKYGIAFEGIADMQPATRWPPQLTMGSVKVTAVAQRPIFLPVDLHAEWDVAIRARSNVLLVGSVVCDRGDARRVEAAP